jgi:transcriptional regulator with XRE-family HTH domain
MPPGYNPQWEKLRKRLLSVCQVRGSRAALAKEYGVTKAAVSQWLNGQRFPSGEISLSLLEWVARIESKQEESRRSVRAPRRRKARSTSNSYETRKTSQRKG